MGPWFWILMALAAILLFFVVPALAMSYALYSILLVRTRPDKWGHECSFPEDEEYVRMYNIGLAWGAEYAAFKRPVEVMSGRFHLVGEYFDFGGKRAVIIIAGRTESYLYSYYFAEPYRKAGYNILVIDNRAHGLSDGKINSLGYREYRDIIAWAQLIHTFGNDSIVVHGICIGASTALFTLTSSDCPAYVTAMVAEGMYVNFYESLKNHIIEKGKPLFPILQGTTLLLRVISGANVVTDGPIKRIASMHKPILLLQSEEDTYSLPELAQVLYDKCPSEHKKLTYFPHGAHSRIRINAPEAYDREVTAFLESLNEL